MQTTRNSQLNTSDFHKFHSFASCFCKTVLSNTSCIYFLNIRRYKTSALLGLARSWSLNCRHIAKDTLGNFSTVSTNNFTYRPYFPLTKRMKKYRLFSIIRNSPPAKSYFWIKRKSDCETHVPQSKSFVCNIWIVIENQERLAFAWTTTTHHGNLDAS